MFSNLVVFQKRLASYLCKTLVVTVAATIALPAMAAPIVLDASFESWVRQNNPLRTLAQWDDDLVSVWSSTGGDMRLGVVEFDLSGLVGTTVDKVGLNLWSGLNGFSDDNVPHKQSAFIISPTDPTPSLDWNDVVALQPGAIALETLGKYDIPAVSSEPAIQNIYLFSAGSAVDIGIIQSIVDVGGTLTMVLMADEDGTQYRNSWGDGAYGGTQVPQLVINIPEPTSVLLLGLGGVLLCGYRRLV